MNFAWILAAATAVVAATVIRTFWDLKLDKGWTPWLTFLRVIFILFSAGAIAAAWAAWERGRSRLTPSDIDIRLTANVAGWAGNLTDREPSPPVSVRGDLGDAFVWFEIADLGKEAVTNRPGAKGSPDSRAEFV